MEDSVGEEERRKQGETVAQAKAHQEEEYDAAAAGGVGGGEPGGEGGFLSAVASKIGAAMSGTNGSGGEVNATAASNGDVEQEKRDGNDGGGIFHKLMSSSSPASSPASEAMETEGVKGEENNQYAGGEQGGILSAMASKICVAMSGSNGDGNHSSKDEPKMSNGDAVDHSKGEENVEEGNDGGIMSAMACKIGMAMSGANGNGNHSTEDDARMSNGDAVDQSKVEGKEKGTTRMVMGF